MLDSYYQLYLTDEETETKEQPNITWLHGGWGWTKSGHLVSQFIHWFCLQSKDFLYLPSSFLIHCGHFKGYSCFRFHVLKVWSASR